MTGRRLPDDSDETQAEAGDYWRVRWLGAENEWWFIDPTGKAGSINGHIVVEHDDGSITVSPSIAPQHGEDGWHGHLRRGVWVSA